MAPSKLKPVDATKQKSLLGWLSKPAGDSKPSPSQKPSGQKSNAKSNVSKAEKPSSSVSPSKSSDMDTSNLSTNINSKSMEGVRASNFVETPPTSDPIDVDMLSPEEDEEKRRPQAKAVSLKLWNTPLWCWITSLARRIASNARWSSKIRTRMKACHSRVISPVTGLPHPFLPLLRVCLFIYPDAWLIILTGRTKKPRVSVVLSDDENDGEKLTSFSSRLSRYKKSPSKSCPYIILSYLISIRVLTEVLCSPEIPS